MSMPHEVFGSQDLKDDDGEVIDSLFKEVNAPPELKDATQPILVKALESPKVITRLISRDETINHTWEQPYMVLPSDANRKSLNILVYSPTEVATDGIRFSDENGNIRTSAKVLHGDTVPITDHTGAIYAITCGNGANGFASAPVSLQIWSVTE
jgi:hypothetical protein